MSSLEKKAIDTFNQMWKPWENPSSMSIEKSVATLAREYKGFGSALTEIWRGKKDYQTWSEEALRQSPGGFNMNVKWIETNQIGPNLVSIWGEIIVTIPLPIKNVVIDPLRITALLKEVKGEMKFIQFHASEPDVSTDEELWPGTGEPKVYEAVSVLFTDFVGFAQTVATITPKTLIDELNEIFAKFDKIMNVQGLDKIKTIGDAYMAVGGLNDQRDHASATINAAKDMLEYLERRNKQNSLIWKMRVGIHSGSVVGGVIGSEKLSFDLWGETVNVASRMESSGEPGKINISSSTYDLVKEDFRCTARGKIETKDKSKLDMYFVI